MLAHLTSRRPRAFTAPELLTVIAIVACLALIAIPGYNAIMRSRALSAARQKVAADLRLAQGLAMRSGGLARLHFGTDPAVNLPNQYRIETCAGTGTACDPPAPAAPWTPITGSWVSLSTDIPTATLQTITTSANAALTEVRFNAQGGLTLASRILLTVQAENSTGVIEVTRAGAIRENYQ